MFYNVCSSIFWYQILAWIWGKCSVKWSSCLHGSDRNQTAANQQCFSPLISVQEYQICYIFLLLSLCSYIVKSEIFVSSDVPLNFRDTYYLTAYFLNLMLFFHFFPILSLVWKSWCHMCLCLERCKHVVQDDEDMSDVHLFWTFTLCYNTWLLALNRRLASEQHHCFIFCSQSIFCWPIIIR